MKKKKILCIDIEGGHGGSSRSLFYIISEIVKKKKDKFEIVASAEIVARIEYEKLCEMPYIWKFTKVYVIN